MCYFALITVTHSNTQIFLWTLLHRFDRNVYYTTWFQPWLQPNVSSLLVQNSSKTTKKFFTFDVSTSIRGLHQKKLVLGLLLPVLGAIS